MLKFECKFCYIFSDSDSDGYKFFAISSGDEYEFEMEFFEESATKKYWDTMMNTKTRKKAVKRATYYFLTVHTIEIK